MEFLAVLSSPTVVAGIISLAIIAVTALVKDRLGETEAERLMKIGQSSMRVAEMIVKAAEIAVVEVEKSLKESGTMSNEELKQAAVQITADLLTEWGLVVNRSLIESLFAVVEAAYQRMKVAGV